MDIDNRESKQTRPLFDKAVRELSEILEVGSVTDKEFANAVLQVFTGHIKLLNAERAKDVLRYAVNRSLASNPDEFKELVRKSLPEYASQ